MSSWPATSGRHLAPGGDRAQSVSDPDWADPHANSHFQPPAARRAPCGRRLRGRIGRTGWRRRRHAGRRVVGRPYRCRQRRPPLLPRPRRRARHARGDPRRPRVHNGLPPRRPDAAGAEPGARFLRPARHRRLDAGLRFPGAHRRAVRRGPRGTAEALRHGKGERAGALVGRRGGGALRAAPSRADRPGAPGRRDAAHAGRAGEGVRRDGRRTRQRLDRGHGGSIRRARGGPRQLWAVPGVLRALVHAVLRRPGGDAAEQGGFLRWDARITAQQDDCRGSLHLPLAGRMGLARGRADHRVSRARHPRHRGPASARWCARMGRPHAGRPAHRASRYRALRLPRGPGAVLRRGDAFLAGAP